MNLTLDVSQSYDINYINPKLGKSKEDQLRKSMQINSPENINNKSKKKNPILKNQFFTISKSVNSYKDISPQIRKTVT